MLTSLAEELLSRKESLPSEQSALKNLEEALEMFQKCLSLQERRYDEFETQKLEAAKYAEEMDMDAMPSVGAADPEETEKQNSDQEDSTDWASVVEPVTQDTLLDTVMAQLSSLTTLCGILGSNQDLVGKPNVAWVEEYAQSLFSDRLPKLVEATDREVEATVAKAKLSTTLLEAGFRTGQIDARTYKQELDATFENLGAQLLQNPEVILGQVDALFTFNTALSEMTLDFSETAENKSKLSDRARLRWSALDKVFIVLMIAASIPLTESTPAGFRPQTHYLRGDASMLQARLSSPPYSYPPAIHNKAALLKNATVFYGNASRLWTGTPQEVDNSKFRESVANLLLEQATKQHRMAKSMLEDLKKSKGEAWMEEQAEEMASEGVLGEGDLQSG